jgi:hypothetical protein
MTVEAKLSALLAAIQTDPGNRGLARDPHDNLFTACAGDFSEACRSIAAHDSPVLQVVTGFYIPTASPPAMETDGPLGAVFLARALAALRIEVSIVSENACRKAISAGLAAVGQQPRFIEVAGTRGGVAGGMNEMLLGASADPTCWPTHRIGLERVGPAGDGRCYSMRGRDISDHTAPAELLFTEENWRYSGPRENEGRPSWLVETIGIGDGGNEIGMGKIAHETIVKNIPGGDKIHCRVSTDRLIVAGVSNWGAYALAAGVYILRGAQPLKDIFEPEEERRILEAMVEDGPLVDGVTGRQTATVDGLSWEEYSKPLRMIQAILET